MKLAAFMLFCYALQIAFYKRNQNRGRGPILYTKNVPVLLSVSMLRVVYTVLDAFLIVKNKVLLCHFTF